MVKPRRRRGSAGIEPQKVEFLIRRSHHVTKRRLSTPIAFLMTLVVFMFSSFRMLMARHFLPYIPAVPNASETMNPREPTPAQTLCFK